MRIKSFVSVISLAALTLSAAAQAETLDFGIGDDSAHISLTGPMTIRETGTLYDMGFIFSDDRNADLNQAHLGLMVTGDTGARNADVTAGLGLRLLFADLVDSTGGAVALGGRVETRVPSIDRLGFTAYGWYAPEITSFSEIDGYTELAASVDYQVIRNAAIFLGYRQIRYEINGNSDRVDDGLHLGFRLTL